MSRQSADVVVIGLGVIGASIAFHLAERGAGRVVAIDKGAAGEGMTGRSTGLVRTHYLNAPEARLALAALPYWHNWSERVGGPSPFVHSGALITVRPDDGATLREVVAMLQGEGVNTRVVEPWEVAELQPGLRIDDLGPAAYEPDSGYCDPPADAARSFAAAARRLGADVREHVRVERIRVQDSRVVGVDTAQGPIDTGTVVLATNVWSDTLGRTAGLDVPIHRRRGQTARLPRPPLLAGGYAVTLDRVCGISTRPAGTDQAMTTLGAGYTAEVADPDDFDEGLDPQIAGLLQRLLSTRYPAFEGQQVVTGHAGLYDMSPDHRAILDAAPEPDGLFVAVGFSGTGFKKSPIVGACMAELITDGAASAADIHPFRWSRFDEGQPITDDWTVTIPTLAERL